MEHFVTLFDAGFLPQGMALHRSLQRQAGDFTLWVLCMDDAAHVQLERLQLPGVRLLRLADLETEALRAVKDGRSRAEYCWTLTPFCADFVFERDADVRRVTYVDADVWFAKPPQTIFEEFERSGKSVFITPHGYAPEYDQADVTGEFCVQFVTFDRLRSEAVRRQWQHQCIEWCFARSEPGRFGDQKYLDEWPRTFPREVHVSERLEVFQAPWNATRFAPSECRIYHFHGLRLMRNDRVLLAGHYRIPRSTLRIVYQPYLDDLSESMAVLRKAGFEPRVQAPGAVWLLRLRTMAVRLRHRFRAWFRPDFSRLRMPNPQHE
jgi:hypothetical protein